MTTSGGDAPLTRAIEPRDAEPLARLFDETGSPCFCRYWHFRGDANAWLDRCANATSDNRDELVRSVAGGTDEMRGIVAEHGGRLVGWLKVAPSEVMQKAYERRLYKGLPCFEGDRRGVFVVGCALVLAPFRKTGLATAMVARAVDLAPGWGALVLEAFPRRPKEPVADEELWTLPVGALEKNGFVEVHAFEPYPVLRRVL